MASNNSFNLKEDQALAALARSLGTANFPKALSYFVNRLVEFDNLIFIAYHKDRVPEALYSESFGSLLINLFENHYLKGAYMLDPFFHATKNGVQTGIHNIFDLAPDHFKHTNYYKEYYINAPVIDEIALFAPLGTETTLTACFTRDKKRDQRFTKKEIKRLKMFENVLSALCEQNWSSYQPQKSHTTENLNSVTERLREALEYQQQISLSPRQAEVAFYILQGHSSVSISLILQISKETVKVFRKQLYSKCNISSQAELFALLMPVISTL